jgi:hypothetical protein
MASYERYREYASLTAAELAAVNNIFPQGLLVVEADTGKMKVGDGTTAYNSLPYGPTTLSSLTLLNGTANGVLYLNGSNQLTSGSVLSFDGTNLILNGTFSAAEIVDTEASFSWDSATATPGSAVGAAPKVTTVHQNMRRCVVNDSGVVQYYLLGTDSTKKADGNTATLTGADGQVMVEIPKFYTRRTVVGTVTTWSISSVARTGYTVHPAFVKDGVEVPYRYIGAYDACVYDDSAAAYISGLNWDDNISPNGVAVDSAADKLASVSGVYPMVGLTRAEFRTLAANRGAGWRQLDWTLFAAVQLLYLVEFQSFFSQAITGDGNTATSYAGSSGTQSDNGGSEAGKSNSIGNASTNTTNGASSASRGVAWMSYRGIENIYGNEWNFVDGVIVNPDGSVGTDAGDWWFTNNSSSFSDSVRTGMTQITASAATGANYVSVIAAVDNFFIATSVSGGSSSTYLTDYHYGSTAADRVVFVGGGADNGSDAGLFFVDARNDASLRYRSVGARLAF